MAASPQHITLSAGGPATTVTFDSNFGVVEVLNRTGIDEVFFTTDGSTPSVGGAGCEIAPAAIGSTRVIDAGAGAVTVVKLISASAVKVTVRGS